MGNIEIAMSRKSVDLKKSTIFIAGVYGTGKSTMCSALSKMLHIPAFSAGDLISSINGEKYGANKAVTDKDGNQALLVERIQQLFKKYERIILAGHFCIFNANAGIEILPESVYHALSISQIILLETNSQTIISNLRRRDGMDYSQKSISKLIEKEREQSERISEQLNCPLSIYQMMFTGQDVKQIALLINQGEEI